MIVLYYWRREAGREGGGMEIRAGQEWQLVSEEMKEGQSGSGEHGAREGGRTERGE